MIRRALAAATAVAVSLGLAVAVPSAGAAGRSQPEAPAELVVVDQTTLLPPGGTFSIAVLAELPGARDLRLIVHDRARSRSELAGALAGRSTRGALRTEVVPLASLPVEADGSQRASVALGGPAGGAVTTPGVYPVEVEVLDPDGAVVGAATTDLVVLPEAAEPTPPLAVAVVAQVAPGADGATDPAGALAVAEALAATPDVPATMAVLPSYLDDLASSSEPEDVALVDALRSAAAGHPVLDLPYAPTSPDQLARAGIADELRHERDRGAAVVRSVLGVAPSQRSWLAGPDLGADGLRLLSALGVREAVVQPGRVERVTDGVLSPARPFELAPPKEGARRPAGPVEPVLALLEDGAAAALGGDEGPALAAARALGDLAQLWFEQPGTARATVLVVPPGVDGSALRRLLEGLRAEAVFRPVAVDDAFTVAEPFAGGDGDPLRRSLVPATERAIPTDVVAGVRDLRSLRTSVVQMVGEGAPAVEGLDRHLLRATAAGLAPPERRRELATGRTVVDRLVDDVSTPEEVTITLTAREGSVPLTIRNDTGGPVEVQLRFRSAKVELPDGDVRTLTLTEQTTRLDVPIRTRASGSFPFTVEVTSPDGQVALSATRYNVRSTAVSGVGLVLSIGAGLFLVVWWARHRRAARATKLVDSGSTT